MVWCATKQTKNCSGKKDGVFGMRYVRVASAQSLFLIVFFCMPAIRQTKQVSQVPVIVSCRLVSLVILSWFWKDGVVLTMDGWIVIPIKRLIETPSSKVKQKDGFVMSPVRIDGIIDGISNSFHIVSIHVFPLRIRFGVADVVIVVAVVVVVMTMAAGVVTVEPTLVMVLPVVTLSVVVIGRCRVVFQEKVVVVEFVKVVVIDASHHGGRIGGPLDEIRHVRLVVRRVAIVVVFVFALFFRRNVGGVKGLDLFAMRGNALVHVPGSGIVHAFEVRGALRSFVVRMLGRPIVGSELCRDGIVALLFGIPCRASVGSMPLAGELDGSRSFVRALRISLEGLRLAFAAVIATAALASRVFLPLLLLLLMLLLLLQYGTRIRVIIG